jgi:hypothetical protein
LYVLEKSDAPICHSRCFGFQLMHNAKICSTEPNSEKLDVLELETRGFSISSSDDLGETATVEPEDWRTPLVHYL